MRPYILCLFLTVLVPCFSPSSLRAFFKTPIRRYTRLHAQLTMCRTPCVMTHNGRSNLEIVYIEGSPITEVGGGIFSDCAKMRVLELSHIDIVTLPKSTFLGLENLEQLTMVQNSDWSSIAAGTFLPLVKLKELVLRSHPKLRFAVLDRMPALNRILLANLKGMDTLPNGMFGNLPKLKSMTLEWNAELHTIEEGAFKGAGSLEELHIIESRNLTTVDDNAFAGLTSLETLEIRCNAGGITAIKQKSLAQLPALKHLVLQVAGLTSIEDDAFAELASLEVLTIANAQKLAILPATLMRGLEASLLRFELIELGIRSLPDELLAGMDSLQKIKFACLSALQSIPKHFFAGVQKRCEEVSIHKTGLRSLAVNMFAGLSKLHDLSITSNAFLTRLEASTFDNAFDETAGSVRVKLENNPFEFISSRAINFDDKGAPERTTLVTVSSMQGTRLDNCCTYAWLHEDHHFITSGVQCLDSRSTASGTNASVVALGGGDHTFGCCFEDTEWEAKITAINNVTAVGSYASLSDDIRGKVADLCRNSMWNQSTKLRDMKSGGTAACTTPIDPDCTPSIQPWFNLKYVESDQRCSSRSKCPSGYRAEAIGQRHLLNCEPFLHAPRQYETEFAVAEQLCVACAVPHCKSCSGNYRLCEACSPGYSLDIESTSGTLAHACISTCKQGFFSGAVSEIAENSSTAVVAVKGRQCFQLTECGEGQQEREPESDEANPYEFTDRVCQAEAIPTPVDSGTSSGNDVGAVIGVFFVLSLIAIAVYMYRNHHLKMRAHDFQQQLKDLTGNGAIDEYYEPNENPEKQSKLPREIKRRHITMMAVVGEGKFGEVRSAVLDERGGGGGLDVAVKTSIEANGEGADEIRLEALVMAQLNDHEHVAELIGVVTSGKPLLLVLQFYENGSLLSCLKEKKLPGQDNTVKGYLPPSAVTTARLALEIARGMNYIAKAKFVHRDLAARNILLDTNFSVKIADFGLSRGVKAGVQDAEEEYYKSLKSAFPVRWTDPEALQAHKFTAASDVWSYGVVLMEIVQGGQRPYHHLGNDDVMKAVIRGQTAPQPKKGCTDEIYSVISQCWQLLPKDRPTFEQLLPDLEKHLEDVPEHDHRPKLRRVNTKQAKANERWSSLTKSVAEQIEKGGVIKQKSTLALKLAAKHGPVVVKPKVKMSAEEYYSQKKKEMYKRVLSKDCQLAKDDLVSPFAEIDSVVLVGLYEAVDAFFSHSNDGFVDQLQEALAFAQDLVDAGESQGLTVDEAAAIHFYTSQCLFYVLLNGVLGGWGKDGREPLPLYLPYSKLVLSALNKLPNVEATVYRGVQGVPLEKLLGGKVEGHFLTWWAFTSTTESSDVLRKPYFLGFTGEHRTVFVLKVKSGVRIKRFSSFGGDEIEPESEDEEIEGIDDEDEVLIKPGTQFVITSIKDYDGVTEVSMTEVVKVNVAVDVEVEVDPVAHSHDEDGYMRPKVDLENIESTDLII